MKVVKVIKADFFRWFGKKKWFLGFLGIIALNYFIILQDFGGIREANLVDLVFFYMDDPFYVINFMIAAILMGTSYCEEKEKGYYYFWIKRCDEKTYMISKILNCFFSSFTLLALGMFTWILSLRLFLPWNDPASGQFEVVLEQGMGELLQTGHFLLYYALYCVGIGMMAGILSVGTFTISLFLENQMMTILLAALLFYLNVAYMGSISESLERWSLQQILYFPFSQMSSAGLTVLRGVLYTIMIVGLFGGISYWQLKRRKNCD